MNKSSENLGSAFAGESQANRRYIAYAQKAEQEGYPQIAKLFRAAADAETVHALNHLRIMGEIKSTRENLETAVTGETFEYKDMYPKYISIAEGEGTTQAAWSFNVANKVEEVHAELYSKAIEAIKQHRDLVETDYYVCRVCGNTVENSPPEKCPICGAVKAEFFKVV